MSSVRSRILDAAVASLAGATPAADRVFRSRARMLERGELPAIVVSQGDERSEFLGAGVYRHSLEVKLKFYDHGEDAEVNLDQVITPAHAALATSEYLVGLVKSLRLDRTDEPESDDNDDGSVCIKSTYVVTYSTAQHDLTIKH